MKILLQIIKKCVSNPYMNLIVGIILLYTGISEAWRELKEVEGIQVGAHHGLVVYSILHILKTIPEFFEGLDYIYIAKKEDRPSNNSNEII